jgi:hypothetical protein
MDESSTSQPVLDYRSPRTPGQRQTPWVVEPGAYFLLGIILPIVCFAMSASSYPAAPEFQHPGPEWNELIAMIPQGNCSLIFFPLLAYSMISIGCMIFREPVRFATVRLGLYTGVVLALQYTLIQGIALGRSPANAVGVATILLEGLGAAGIVALLIIGIARLPVLAIALPVLIGIVLLITGRWLSLIGFLPLIFAPVLTLAVFGLASIRAWRYSKKTTWWMMGGGVLWTGAYAGAWRIAFHAAVDAYSKLPPPSSSGCYIATAAARGHDGFVGAQFVKSELGVIRVNEQLRRLKAAEIALRCASPATHRLCRRIYDRVGPRIAQCVRNPWMADLAYCSLKPAEWMATILCSAMIPEFRKCAARIYRTQQ